MTGPDLDAQVREWLERDLGPVLLNVGLSPRWASDLTPALAPVLAAEVAEARAEGAREVLRPIEDRHRPTPNRRCQECNMDVPPSGCPTWQLVRAALDRG